MNIELAYASTLSARLRVSGPSALEAYASEISAGAMELAELGLLAPAHRLLGGAHEAFICLIRDRSLPDELRMSAFEQLAALACDQLQLFAAEDRRGEAEALMKTLRQLFAVHDLDN